jgi:hypothetical protein
VDQATSSVLDYTTIAEIVRTWHDRNARYVPNWEI